jgi:hypothetical protein
MKPIRHVGSLLSRCLPAAVAILLGACSGVETAPGGTGGGGAGGGGVASCAGACTIASWTPTAPLLKPRRDHATFIAETPAGAFLYVAGGGDLDGAFDDVERAAIHADGTLGPFAVVATLPGFSYAAGMAQVGRGVVLAGDWNDISEPHTYVGVVADDGGIAFTSGPPLSVARHALTVSAHGGFVYAVGGVHQHYDDQMENTVVAYSAVIERAPFDGATLGPWAQVDPLPHAIGRHAAIDADDAVYLLGGFAGPDPGGPFSAGADVLRLPFGDGGALGPPTWAGAFVTPRADLAAFAYSGAQFALGSTTGAEAEDVLRAPLREDGTLGSFDAITPLPEPVYVRQTPVYGSFVYVAGGSSGNDQVPQSTVLVGKLVPAQND